MKKQFKNLMIATILVAASTSLHAQSPDPYWTVGTNGNTATAAYRLGTNNAFDLKVIANNKIRMTFKNALTNSNIGMGTTAPLANYGIHMYGGLGRTLAQGLYIQRADATPSNQDCALGIGFSSNLFTGGGIGGGSCGFILTPSANTPAPDMAFSTNNVNPQLIIKYSGNVGIGTSTPTENLVVSEPAGTVAGTQNFLLVETVINPFVSSDQGVIIRKDDGQKRGFKLFQDGSDDANSVFKIASFSASSDIDRLTIKRDNGNVGIGLAAPTHQLQLSTDDAYKTITSTWMVGSDARLKTNIREFTDGLDIIKKISPVKFNYTGKAGTQAGVEAIGTVAQDLQKVAPYMVKSWTYTDDKGSKTEYLGVEYHALFFVLTNAVKELAAENEELKAQLSATNARLDALENKTTSSSQNTSQAISNNATDAQLYQIAPNPFSQKAIITFRLPSNASNAQLLITDAAGKTVKTYSLSNGSTQQEIYANNLTAGVYHYSLLVNGKMIDSKQMVIIK